MPSGREWKSYILRHSIATLACDRATAKRDLEGCMGHGDGSQTKVYAIGEFPSVITALKSIVNGIEKQVPGALH